MRPIIQFATSESGADEFQVAPLMITLQLDRASDAPITVSCTVVPDVGEASPGDDFTVASQMVTFAPGELSKVFEVTIEKDTLDNELAETFELQLTNPTNNARLGEVVRHTVTISNLKLPRARFNTVNTSTSEATPTDLVVNLDAPAQGSSSVVVAISGSAQQGKDFTFTDNTTINIANAAAMGTAPIGEVDDALDEDDEDIVFTIVGASPNIVLESGVTTTHAITDNDLQPNIGFAEPAASTVAEGVGTTTLTVVLSAPSGKTITVDFDRGAGGTAEAGDVTVVAGSLTFAPEETSKTFTVAIVDDDLDEDNDTANITLANATNATLTGATHALTITDNDDPPSVTFTAATSMASENVGPHNIIVQLSGPSEKPITIDFAVDTSGAGASTATQPQDFSINGTTLSFGVGGGLSSAITVNVVDDNSKENGGPETVVIDLSNPVNASIAGQTIRHTFSIVDND